MALAGSVLAAASLGTVTLGGSAVASGSVGTVSAAKKTPPRMTPACRAWWLGDPRHPVTMADDGPTGKCND